MTVRELMEALQFFDPEQFVVIEVNGDVRRTGDYMDADCADPILIHPVSYGGYEIGEGERSEAAVLIH